MLYFENPSAAVILYSLWLYQCARERVCVYMRVGSSKTCRGVEGNSL